MKKTTCLKIGAAAMLVTIVAGCRLMDGASAHATHRASNLYAYLYSDQAGHVDAPGVPTLSLPLRVGIAFVPVDQAKGSHAYWSPEESAFSESQKLALMKEIGDQFKSYPFVKSIELIPTAYLTPRGGFANLDQLRTMYGVEVMALLSYDQVQFNDTGLLSLGYLTIVGAYVIEGEKNDTRTMMDAAVYDLASRRLLFRAPGTGDVKGSSTPVNLSEQLRADSARGFQEAATNLVVNLKAQLEDFRERVKHAPADYKIEHKPGYTGAGAFGGLEACFVLALGVSFLWLRRTQSV